MKGGKVKFGKVDATENQSLASSYGVKGYPTIKYWGYGLEKTSSNAKTYEGQRDATAIQNFANDLLDKANIDPEIFELNTQQIYDNNC